jgi:hypothetical protein
MLIRLAWPDQVQSHRTSSINETLDPLRGTSRPLHPCQQPSFVTRGPSKCWALGCSAVSVIMVYDRSASIGASSPTITRDWPYWRVLNLLESNMHDSDEAVNYIRKKIQRELKLSRSGQRCWSFANHGATILVVIFSSLAAVLAQITGDVVGLGTFGAIPAKNMATALSLLVTITATLQSKLGFERKWVANRLRHSALVQLEIDERTGHTLPDFVEKLKKIQSKHDRSIVGSTS